MLAGGALALRGDPAHLPWDREYRAAQQRLDRGEFEAARGIAARGYAFWSGWSASPWHWRFRLSLAEALLDLERMDEGRNLLGTAAPEHRFEARRQWLLAYASYRRRDDEEALRRMDRAEALAGPADAQLTARVELTRGMLYLKHERYPAAETAFRRAWSGVRGTGTLLESYALADLGHLDLLQFRYDEAVDWFERARRVAEQAGAPRAQALAAGNLGVCYLYLGNFDRSLALLSQALAIAKALDDRVYLQRWLVLAGEVYAAEHQYPEAIAHYNQARALARRGVDDDWLSTILDDLTEMQLDAGDRAAAAALNAEAFRLAARLGTRRALEHARLYAAEIAAAGHLSAEAEAAYRVALEGARAAGDPMSIWKCHAGLATLYRESGRAAEADREYRDAIATVEAEFSKLDQDEWKFTFLDHLIRFYRDYVDFLVERGEPERALEAAESSRARVLAGKLRAGARAGGEVRVADLRRAVAGTGTVLFSYWLAPRRSLLWVIDARGLRQFLLPGADRLSTDVQRYTRALLDGSDPPAGGEASGERLFRELVGDHYTPAAGSTVIIVPDGSLYQLNFGTLVEPGRGRYWLEDATIAIAPSLGLMQRGGRRGASRALVIGDPDFASAEFPHLPSVAREVQMVAGHFPSREVLARAAATPEAYGRSRPGEFSDIHFAAHAVANREHPLDSAILLTGGKLYARDVLAEPLRADLVTLSACQTAAGRTYSGEGLISFAWAFLSAGARNVVAGLWDADDRATAALMSRFYDALAGGLPPARALRQAQLGLLASPWHKPMYWAPFETFTTEW